MTGFQVYQIYLALKLHFTTDNYDIRKTRGRVKVSASAYEKKAKVKFQMQKFAKLYPNDSVIDFFVSNFIAGDKWGGVYNTESHEIYLKWQKTRDSLTYSFKQDLENLSLQYKNIEELWECTHGHPPVITQYFGKTCNLETLVILNKLYKFTTHVDEQLTLNPLWQSISSLINKYSPFIKIEKEKYKTMTEQTFYA